MPARIQLPDPDSCIADMPGLKIYALDINEEFPLYRNIKLIGDKPLYASRRTAHVCWIVHQKRLRRGGDAWRLVQARPDLAQWIESVCVDVFDNNYLADTFGLSESEIADLIQAEQDKYD